ncbi:Predicted DNA-binding transcriptional regulator AlpA [Syntrophus gentianae]|uniref:Predicted DNA-binding transcriptional regulator AlpA n=1 Tax=Syntrophus gentianae TaxID=43775 RepID=A0A1H8BET4_9BACT|nr:AlpA family phage regulatory protein [Syntrophus gentianae]SEM80367.1 Predicted DNA-binding transcriptional regulator AlpA [Syntrophus gentianae]
MKKKKSKNNDQTNTLPEVGYVRLSKFLSVYPVSRSTLFDMVRKGLAPKPIKLSKRCVAWHVDDIKSFINRTRETSDF